MQRISLGWFSEFGSLLRPLADFEREVQPHELFRIKEYLDVLADERRIPLDLRASRPVIGELIQIIAAVIAAQDQKVEISKYRWQIPLLSSKLETLVNGELAVQSVYHVWPKRAYNVEILINSGENLFSIDVRENLNAQELYDLRQAGKCLAFEISTAAAFHMFRAAESVLRRYYSFVVGTAPKTKMRNWGAYIKHLREAHVDGKVILPLEQIKDLHRNPVIHPESQMQMEETLSLIGVLESAISAMIEDMNTRANQLQLKLPAMTTSPQITVLGEASAE